MPLSHVTWATCPGWGSGAKGRSSPDSWTSSRLWREGKHTSFIHTCINAIQIPGVLQCDKALWEVGVNCAYRNTAHSVTFLLQGSGGDGDCGNGYEGMLCDKVLFCHSSVCRLP